MSRRDDGADLVLAIIVAVLLFVILTTVDGELLGDSMPWGVELFICFAFAGSAWFIRAKGKS